MAETEKQKTLAELCNDSALSWANFKANVSGLMDKKTLSGREGVTLLQIAADAERMSNPLIGNRMRYMADMQLLQMGAWEYGAKKIGSFQSWAKANPGLDPDDYKSQVTTAGYPSILTDMGVSREQQRMYFGIGGREQ